MINRPINQKRLAEKRNPKTSEMLRMADDNQAPMQGVEMNLKDSKLLAPYSSGDPVMDMHEIDLQLNRLPQMLADCSENQLSQMWDKAVKVGRRSIWIMAQIAITVQRKFGEESIVGFAEEKGVSKSTIYNYLKLAETFPAIDPDLDTTFYFRALDAGHGDKEKSLKLIEIAKQKKNENPAYSTRDFEKDLAAESSRQSTPKPKPTIGLLHRAIADLKALGTRNDIGSYSDEVKKVNTLAENLSLKQDQLFHALGKVGDDATASGEANDDSHEA